MWLTQEHFVLKTLTMMVEDQVFKRYMYVALNVIFFVVYMCTCK